MLRATKGKSRSRRAAALLLAICMTMMTILPSLATPAKAIAGVDDVAVAAFVATLFVGTGVTIQHVTSSEAFQSAVVSYWNKTVTTSSEIYKSFTRWLRDGYVTLKQDALAWVHTAADYIAETNRPAYTVDSRFPTSQYPSYLGSYYGIPCYDLNVGGSQPYLTFQQYFGIDYTTLTESSPLIVNIGATTYKFYQSASSGACVAKVKQSDGSYDSAYQVNCMSIMLLRELPEYSYHLGDVRIKSSDDIAILNDISNGTTAAISTSDIAISEPSTWTVNTEDLQPDPEKDDKHQPIAFVPFIPHWSNKDLLDKLLDGTAKPEIVKTTPAEKSADMTETGEATDEGNYDGIKNIGLAFTTVFPFCIPFDLYHFCEALNASAEAPRFEIELPATEWTQSYTFDLDFSRFDTIALLFRKSILLLFCIGLAAATAKFIKW